MNPIISPVLIYLIGISSNIQWLCNLLAGLAISFAVIASVYCLVNEVTVYDDDDKRYTTRLCIKIIKYSLIYAAILGVISALIPSKQIATAMLISSYVTPDNLHGVNDVIKANLQDYINIIVNGIKDVK